MMKTKVVEKNRINIITLGCSKNLVDSEALGGQLRANGLAAIHESPRLKHNIVIVNTCGFIESAKEESIQTILQQVDLKQQGKLDKVYVTGCLSARYRGELALEIPEVDEWFTTLEMPSLLQRLNADYRSDLLGERMAATPSHYAYLKISEGCNRTCAFCAIPLMRGKHASRPMEQLVAEAEKMVAGGVKEILVIAQELTYYGLDLYKTRTLAPLLEKLSGIRGLKWIRLHYAYPQKFPLEVLDVISGNENICKYLDIPLQHISNRMLSRMRRNITKQEILDLIDTIRDRIPGICLRTTLIAGFPGESAEDTSELLEFLQETRLDRVGVFTYSHEEGTGAYALKDDVPETEKKARAEQIMDVQREISYEKNLEKVGKTFQVLVDKKEAGQYIGRTEFDSVEVDNEVIIRSEYPLEPGTFIKTRITKAFDYDLEGVPV
jgi:ribosomal protein S12 methylthiotransferase